MAETKATDIGVDAEQSYHRIAEAAEKLLPLLLEDDRKKVREAIELLTRKVIPLLRHECPLLVAVTGGGSVGKSTVFNMLAGGKFSGVKSKAGYTKRTLAAIHPSISKNKDRMSLLFELFKKNAIPVLLKSPDEMLKEGDPLYVESDNIPEHMAVLDTPDFDTGDKDSFANRDAAEEILAASDVLVYLFTNPTYNNKANTDFVRNAISDIGRRKVVLVYRCSAAIPEEEAGEHMDEVLRNLFPESSHPRSEALGLYRVDESDSVVRGEAAPVLRPLAGYAEIMDLINGMDIVEVRKDNLRSQCVAIVKEMKNALDEVSLHRDELIAYRDAVRALGSHAVLKGLKHVPQGLLMEQFVECWREAQPRPIRIAHGMGRGLSAGIRGLSAGIKWVRNKFIRNEMPGGETASEDYEKTLRSDFKDSAGKLRANLSQPVLSVEVSRKDVDGARLCDVVKTLTARNRDDCKCSEYGKDRAVCTVCRPTVLADEMVDILKAITDAGNDEVWIEEAVRISQLTEDVRKDIKDLVVNTRKNMSFWEKSKEKLWAIVATLPPIVAVAYIVCTYDPVVGTGVIAHLGAIFGLGDFYAAIAIPASLGLDEAHKKFLENNLKGLYEKWFARKRDPICGLIDANITARCTKPCDILLETTEAPFKRLQEAVNSFDNFAETKENAL